MCIAGRRPLMLLLHCLPATCTDHPSAIHMHHCLLTHPHALPPWPLCAAALPLPTRRTPARATCSSRRPGMTVSASYEPPSGRPINGAPEPGRGAVAATTPR